MQSRIGPERSGGLTIERQPVLGARTQPQRSCNCQPFASAQDQSAIGRKRSHVSDTEAKLDSVEVKIKPSKPGKNQRSEEGSLE